MFVSGGKQFVYVLTLGQLDTIIFIFGQPINNCFHGENTFYLLTSSMFNLFLMLSDKSVGADTNRSP
jgi:hypothetical protein